MEVAPRRRGAAAYLARGLSLALGLGLAVQAAACAPTTLVYNPGHVPADQMSRIQNVRAMVARLPSGRRRTTMYARRACRARSHRG